MKPGMDTHQFLPDGIHFLYFVEGVNPDTQEISGAFLTRPQQPLQIIRTGASRRPSTPRLSLAGRATCLFRGIKRCLHSVLTPQSFLWRVIPYRLPRMYP